MTALANSLKRIWSARNRVLDLTGSGTSGFFSKNETTLAGWAHEHALALIGLARRTAPTVIVIACNLFR
jgi:hypothetical protein